MSGRTRGPLSRLRHGVQEAGRSLADGPRLGWRFNLRHLAPVRRQWELASAVRGYGVIHHRRRSSDLQTIREIFGQNVYDLSGNPHFAALRRRYEAMLAAGDVPVIVDAGANIGAASVYFARAFPRARVVAIEPDPGNARIARLNVAAWPGVMLVEGAIGAEPGVVMIDRTLPDNNAVQTVRVAEGAGVAVHTVPGLLGMVPGGRLLIVKVDIEGFESDLFARNTEWVGEAPVVIVEPHDWLMPGRHSSSAFQSVTSAYRMEVFIQFENLVYVNTGLLG